jgi:putative ABC transport system permease protein
MDRATYDRLWDDPVTGTFTVKAKSGVTPEQLRDAVLQRLGTSQGIQVQLNRTFKQDLLARVDQAFAISYALQLVTVVVAMLGVISTVMVSVMERKREFGLLRAFGVLRRQIVGLILVESGLIGLIGGLLGLVVGAGVASVAIQAAGLSYGTPLGYYFPGQVAIIAVILMTVMSVVAGLYPSLTTLRLEVVRSITTE